MRGTDRYGKSIMLDILHTLTPHLSFLALAIITGPYYHYVQDLFVQSNERLPWLLLPLTF